MAKGYAIYSKELGILIGTFLGMAFWSNLDPVGHDCAVLFPSLEAAGGFAIETGESELSIVEVENDRGGYASIAACVAAGLPAWDKDAIPKE